MLICIRRIIKCLLIFALVLASLSVQSCRANWPEPLDTQPISQALVNISVMPLQSLHLRQHSRPTTEAYRTLRLQVPSTLILKTWIEEREVGQRHPRGRPKTALQDASRYSGPRARSGNKGFRCLSLSEHQCLNSLCSHVPRHVRHSQALEVRSRATTCTKPKASLYHPLLPSGRATNGAEMPAQHRTHSGVRGAQASVYQLTVHASRHSCDHRASAVDALPYAGQSIAFSSMPPDRYPRSRYRPDGTRRRTQNEWLARKGKGKGDGNTKGKGKGGGRGGQGNGKGEPRDHENDRPRYSQEHRDDRDHHDRDDRRDRETPDEGHRRRRDAHRHWEEPEEGMGSTCRVPRTDRRQDREEERQRDRSRDRDRGTWTRMDLAEQ